MTVYMAIHMILEDSPQKPDVSVPSGETVIDYMEMLSLLINMP
jgi:hypothetical protein